MNAIGFVGSFVAIAGVHGEAKAGDFPSDIELFFPDRTRQTSLREQARSDAAFGVVAVTAMWDCQWHLCVLDARSRQLTIWGSSGLRFFGLAQMRSRLPGWGSALVDVAPMADREAAALLSARCAQGRAPGVVAPDEARCRRASLTTGGVSAHAAYVASRRASGPPSSESATELFRLHIDWEGIPKP